MKLFLVTPPTLQAVTLSDVRTHLRIDASDEDTYLNMLIATATHKAQEITGRKLLTQTWDYSIDCWPASGFIKLPFGCLQNVPATQSVKWKDETGSETTLTVTTDYLWIPKGDNFWGHVTLPYGGTWPTGTLYPEDAITIRYVCGWTRAGDVLPDIKSGILMLIAKLYESRGEDFVSPGGTRIEDETALNLLRSCRLWDEL